MATFLPDLTISLVGYALMALVYFGWGVLFARFLSICFEPFERPFSLTWLGWAISLVFFNLWNFLLPVSIYASLIFLAFGLSFAIPRFVKSSPGHPTMFHLGYGIALALLSVWIASRSMLGPANGDSGLYHFNSIRWINEYAIIPGLGNLHGRLAFNQSFFTYVASLNLFPLFNHGHNLANSFLFLLLFAELLHHMFTVICNLPKAVDQYRSSMVAVFFIPFVTYRLLFSDLSSPTPDEASVVLQVLLFIHYVNFLKAKAFDKYADSRLALIVILSATLVTVKLSNSFYATIIFASSMFFRFRGSLTTRSYPLSTINKLTIVACMILIPWLCRGLITSGYPAYPSTLGHIQADWSVPLEKTRQEAAWIYSWAREPTTQPNAVLSNWNWLVPWFNHLVRHAFPSVVYPICVSVLSMILVLGFLISRRRIRRKDGVPLLITLVLLPPFAAILFWFSVAPDTRFAHSLFYVAAIASSVSLVEIGEIIWKDELLLISCFLFLVVNVAIVYRLSNNLWTFTYLSTAGYIPIPKVELVEKRTETGLKIYVPARDRYCWNSPIPCTPYFNPELRLTGSDIKSGFTVAPKREG
jgi:hypothetical protein